MKKPLTLGLGAVAFAAVWIAAEELPVPARAVAAFLVGPLVAVSALQASAISELQSEQIPSRMRLYVGTIIGLWGLAFAAAVAASESGFPPALVGVALLPWSDFWLWFLFAMTAAAAIVVGFKAFGIRETETLRHLIPQTPAEKLTFVGVSITAGICEELVFRGFLIAALNVGFGSITAAVLIAAVVFGAVHAHQNVSGGVRAAVLGLVLSVPLLLTGSLYPGIAAHAAVDLLGGLWLSKWLLRS